MGDARCRVGRHDPSTSIGCPDGAPNASTCPARSSSSTVRRPASTSSPCARWPTTLDVDAGELLAAGMLHEAQHRLLAVLGGSGAEGAVGARRSGHRSHRSAPIDCSTVCGPSPSGTRRSPWPTAHGASTTELDDPMAGRAASRRPSSPGRGREPGLIPFRVLFVEPTPEPPVLAEVTETFAEHLAVSGPSGLDGRPHRPDGRPARARRAMRRSRWAHSCGSSAITGDRSWATCSTSSSWRST